MVKVLIEEGDSDKEKMDKMGGQIRAAVQDDWLEIRCTWPILSVKESEF